MSYDCGYRQAHITRLIKGAIAAGIDPDKIVIIVEPSGVLALHCGGIGKLEREPGPSTNMDFA